MSFIFPLPTHLQPGSLKDLLHLTFVHVVGQVGNVSREGWPSRDPAWKFLHNWFNLVGEFHNVYIEWFEWHWALSKSPCPQFDIGHTFLPLSCPPINTDSPSSCNRSNLYNLLIIVNVRTECCRRCSRQDNLRRSKLKVKNGVFWKKFSLVEVNQVF